MIIKLKQRGIKRRWVFSSLFLFILVVLVFEIILILIVHNYYYSAAKTHMSKISNIPYIADYGEDNTSADYEQLAVEYISTLNEEILSKTQVQVIDSQGNIKSSSGINVAGSQVTADYAIAKSNSSGVGYWQGDLESGENVISVTKVLNPGGNPDEMIAVQYISSLEEVDKNIFYIDLILITIGVIIVAILAFSGLFIINPILNEINKLNSAAKKIAEGNFSVRISGYKDDEIGELSKNMNYMASELELSQKSKNDFISSVSHEIRTPLTAIKGWGETVESSIDDDPELVRRGLKVILAESDRLSLLVEDLLDFSRVQTVNSMELLDPMDVLSEVTGAVLTYQETAKQQGIELIYTKDSFLPLIYGNKKRIQQVFVNIIDNAIKYSAPGDTITVDARLIEDKIMVVVQDTGCGIPESDITHVKQKFYKANYEKKGSGIGLAVCDEIINHHKGLLTVESVENFGTKVTITLPKISKSKTKNNK